MHQDRTGLEQADRLRPAAVHQRRDFRVRIDRDKAAAELVAVDLDQPGVIFGAAMTGGEQLLEHDRDLDAVRRRQRVQLKRMAADRQLLLMCGTCDRTVDAGEAAAALLVPGPDLRGLIGGGFADAVVHWFSSRLLSAVSWRRSAARRNYSG